MQLLRNLNMRRNKENNAWDKYRFTLARLKASLPRVGVLSILFHDGILFR
jgi:hypothetical protein